MKSSPNQRKTRRFLHEADIMFEHYPSGRYYDGKMYNYSRGGMYIESNFAPGIGTEVFIGIENSPYTSGHDVYRAKIVWHARLKDSKSLYLYGIGVKYF